MEVGSLVATVDTGVSVPGDTGSKPEASPRDPEEKSVKELSDETSKAPAQSEAFPDARMTPVAREMMEKEGLSVEDVIRGLKKITASDVRSVMHAGPTEAKGPAATLQREATRDEERKKMSQLRKRSVSAWSTLKTKLPCSQPSTKRI